MITTLHQLRIFFSILKERANLPRYNDSRNQLKQQSYDNVAEVSSQAPMQDCSC